ncbi:hypothetical protein [Mesorhizobium sp. B1-1-8]|uniref:hypothetical protein n=1 Tax=Mesorhizobium sp. B1-1-8 TaxID=2589976 RepID=UPI00112AB963|nr:hypothetical protein [Mesorhizobium sp. B1-1-8]UCI07152.1 hypothetical protein FJ974_25710 [Mesorhizobium sp. B1-1-8]
MEMAAHTMAVQSKASRIQADFSTVSRYLSKALMSKWVVHPDVDDLAMTDVQQLSRAFGRSFGSSATRALSSVDSEG